MVGTPPRPQRSSNTIRNSSKSNSGNVNAIDTSSPLYPNITNCESSSSSAFSEVVFSLTGLCVGALEGANVGASVSQLSFTVILSCSALVSWIKSSAPCNDTTSTGIYISSYNCDLSVGSDVGALVGDGVGASLYDSLSSFKWLHTTFLIPPRGKYKRIIFDIKESINACSNSITVTFASNEYDIISVIFCLVVISLKLVNNTSCKYVVKLNSRS